MSSKVIKNLLSLTANQYFALAANFALGVFLARFLGAADFGYYTTIMSYLFFGGIITNFGIQNVVVRNVARAKDEAVSYFFNSVLVMVFLGLVSWGGIVGVSFLIDYPARFRELLVFAGFNLVFLGIFHPSGSIIRAYERMEIPSIVSILANTLGAAVAIGLLLLGYGLFMAIFVFLIQSALEAIILFYLTHKKFAPFKYSLDYSLSWRIVKESTPIAFIGALQRLTHRVDVIMLSAMVLPTEVGAYGAALKIVNFFMAPTRALAQALLPHFSAKLAQGSEILQKTYEEVLKISIIVSLPAVAGTFFFAQFIIKFLFGQNFVEIGSVWALKLLSLAFLCDLVSGPVNVVLLNSQERIIKFVPYAGFVTILKIILNLLLIPKYSFIGASISTVFCSIVATIIKIILVHRFFEQRPKLFTFAWKPLLACLPLIILFALPIKIYWLSISIPLAFFSYYFGLVKLKAFSEEDKLYWRKLKDSVGGKINFRKKSKSMKF